MLTQQLPDLTPKVFQTSGRDLYRNDDDIDLYDTLDKQNGDADGERIHSLSYQIVWVLELGFLWQYLKFMKS